MALLGPSRRGLCGRWRRRARRDAGRRAGGDGTSGTRRRCLNSSYRRAGSRPEGLAINNAIARRAIFTPSFDIEPAPAQARHSRSEGVREPVGDLDEVVQARPIGAIQQADDVGQFAAISRHAGRWRCCRSLAACILFAKGSIQRSAVRLRHRGGRKQGHTLERLRDGSGSLSSWPPAP
jgi:hypothetical protein